ncbi:lipopolysaccharide kinase InaA family protein [Salinisphaera sp.]|mgnify:FL=1|uniref:lipopolysaccharide kinase InaA family protein n=1 Tax=Salinisphaera sp. TaxID=1914330 RepID=UPI0025CDA6E2|nr:lipopolysaccharide kinase InaA family protein [Salinisphaera sp.]
MIFRSLIATQDRWLFPTGLSWDAPRVRNSLDAPVANESPYAVIATTAPYSRADAVKLIRPRSWPRDAVRKYFRCQARREYEAAQQLAAWGIPSIPVHGWGVALAPRARYESMLLMTYQPGCQNARRYLEAQPDSVTQWRLLEAIAADVAAIYARGYHHNDCHLGNVLVDGTGNRTWIDNELRLIRNVKQLAHRFEQTLILLDRSLKQAVPAAMKQAFQARCRELLRQTQTGSR